MLNQGTVLESPVVTKGSLEENRKGSRDKDWCSLPPRSRGHRGAGADGRTEGGDMGPERALGCKQLVRRWGQAQDLPMRAGDQDGGWRWWHKHQGH